MASRVVIVGGPRRGKSWLARELSAPVFCGDPRSKVKDPEEGVHYLPEGIPFAGDDGAAMWVACNWFTMPGPWVLEGHVMARALRRWTRDHYNGYPCDRIIVLDRPAMCDATRGQDSMHTGVMKVWSEIDWRFSEITETRT